MEEEKFLQGIPILQNLDEGELRAFLGIARRVQFPRGKVIPKEGEVGDTLSFLLDFFPGKMSPKKYPGEMP